MNKKFKNRYRISSARLKNYNYSNEGMYFITICTKDRHNYFGKISNGKMILSEIGKIVSEEWKKSEEIRNHIFLDEWIIMPNHIHGVVVINYDNVPARDVLAKRLPMKKGVLSNEKILSKGDVLAKRLYEYDGKHPEMSKISPVSNSVSTMIRFFKSAVTKRAKLIDSHFGWQTRFYDHIIKNEKSLNNIRKYIIENPTIWQRDRNN